MKMKQDGQLSVEQSAKVSAAIDAELAGLLP